MTEAYECRERWTAIAMEDVVRLWGTMWVIRHGGWQRGLSSDDDTEADPFKRRRSALACGPWAYHALCVAQRVWHKRWAGILSSSRWSHPLTSERP
jgi:hypothetical protein